MSGISFAVSALPDVAEFQSLSRHHCKESAVIEFFPNCISTLDSKVHEIMEKKHSGPILVSTKEFEPMSVHIDSHNSVMIVLITIYCPIIRVLTSN
jgi:hypothetical protein